MRPEFQAMTWYADCRHLISDSGRCAVSAETYPDSRATAASMNIMGTWSRARVTARLRK
jgi:hypothetical protein